MSVAVNAPRQHLWLEGLGDWRWPGRRVAGAAEVMPPAWVPALPPRLRPALAPAGGIAAPARWQPGRARARRLLLGALLGALLSLGLALAQPGQLTLAGIAGWGADEEAPAISSEPATPSLPTLDLLSRDAAGSAIDRTSYASTALHAQGSFLVYLPAGYGATTAHYPVVYMLTGDDQSDTAFLQIGLQGQLDRLIAAHAIPPLIAVMIQGGPGTNNWRNRGSRRYESYILEVQELADRMLPTLPERDSRAIVGDSMGGYGAMNAALANPYRFGVVESWIGFFNGLDGHLRADRPVIARLGLDAFVYGGEQDRIADPGEDLPFASALRAAGADAKGAVYPGEHDYAILEAHLQSMLVFAGRSLRRTP